MAELPVFGKASSGAADRKAETVFGGFAQCAAEPDKTAKAYPKLRSTRPQYGSLRFNRLTYNDGQGPAYRFVVDESAGTGKGYDTLYFDANGDGDLTNDPVPQAIGNPPAETIVPYWKSKQIVFDGLSVPIDYGPGLGTRPFKLLARLTIIDDKRISMWFLPTVQRKGDIAIGNRRFVAILKQPHVLTGRFDQPYVELQLTPIKPAERLESWWESDVLAAMHDVDGQLYALAATPLGDRLFVRPYAGKYGTLVLGPGHRDLKRLEFRGTLRSESAVVRLWRRPGGKSPAEKGVEFEVPVGDYLPAYLSVDYGRVHFTLSETYHCEDHPRGRQDKPMVYAIRIREGKPCVLDFSGAPAVMFTSPAKARVFHAGDEVQVSAVLTDPSLDIMIRRLESLDRTQKEVYKLKDGKEQTHERPAVLDPVVTITDPSGKEVAKGKMPFG